MSDKSAAVHIAQLLTAAPLSYVIGTDLFVSSEPTEPDDVVTVYDNSGETPGNLIDQNDRYEYLMVQIIVRRNGYRDAMNDIYAIVDELDYKLNTTKDNLNYVAIILNSGPVSIGKDENNRSRVSANFRIQRT